MSILKTIFGLTALSVMPVFAQNAEYVSQVWVSDLGNGKYKNPVLYADYSDPDACRVGDDYYMTSSSFNCLPGLQILHSKDLVNWTIIGAAIPYELSPVQTPERPEHGNRVWAPSIRHHNGEFYIFWGDPDQGAFMVKAKDPKGPWSEPVLVKAGKGIIDTCPLWDEDGKVYMVHAYAGSRAGLKSVIAVCELNAEADKAITQSRIVFDGHEAHQTCEGPKFYKKDGYYYLMLSEGGTEHGHSVTIARSKYLLGPYESNPANPILTHFNMKMQESEIQGVGHADLVQAPDKSWWMICLGYRTSGYLQHVMGRETFLAPVRWDTGAWPVVNSDGTLQTNMKCKTLPLVPMHKEPEIDEFEESELACYWSFLNIPDSMNYSLKERRGFLRLRPSEKTLDEKANPTFIGRRQTEKKFMATALLDASRIGNKTQAGITAYAARLNHYDVIVNSDEVGNKSVQAVVRIGQSRNVIAELPLFNDKVYLRIDSDSYFYNLSFSVDNKTFVHLGKMEYRYLSTETVGGFCGVHIGVYAQSPEPSGYVDVDYFEYNTK